MSLPVHCYQCSWLVDKMGACGPPGSSMLFAAASFIPYLIIILFIALSFITRTQRQFKMAVLLLSAYVIGDRILKNAIQSPRPQGACKKSFGFPSSHMTVLVCYTTSLWENCKISQKIFLILMIILQGFARIQLKYHTWEQVIGGTIFGIIYALIFMKVYQKLQTSTLFQRISSMLRIKKSQNKKKSR